MFSSCTRGVWFKEFGHICSARIGSREILHEPPTSLSGDFQASTNHGFLRIFPGINSLRWGWSENRFTKISSVSIRFAKNTPCKIISLVDSLSYRGAQDQLEDLDLIFDTIRAKTKNLFALREVLLKIGKVSN